MGGKLYGWSYNFHGGLGLDAPSFSPPVFPPVQPPISGDFISIASGGNYSLVVRDDGTMWASGYGMSGQLGQGVAVSSPVFIQVGTDSDWAKVFAGENRCFAIKEDGSLWAWGDAGSYSFLGLGDNTDRYSPTQVGSSTLWQSISISTYHTVGLMSDGTVWTWGRNMSGVLGFVDTSHRTTPAQITSITNAVKVSAGGAHQHIITADGLLYGNGSNMEYQLGISSSQSDIRTPTQIGLSSDWVDISGGSRHSLALNASGELYACGTNAYGQCGNGTTDTITSFMLVSAGWAKLPRTNGYRALGIKQDGTLWGWGSNSYSAVDATSANILSPIKIEMDGQVLDASSTMGALALVSVSAHFWTNFSGQSEIL